MKSESLTLDIAMSFNHFSRLKNFSLFKSTIKQSQFYNRSFQLWLVKKFYVHSNLTLINSQIGDHFNWICLKHEHEWSWFDVWLKSVLTSVISNIIQLKSDGFYFMQWFHSNQIIVSSWVELFSWVELSSVGDVMLRYVMLLCYVMLCYVMLCWKVKNFKHDIYSVQKYLFAGDLSFYLVWLGMWDAKHTDCYAADVRCRWSILKFLFYKIKKVTQFFENIKNWKIDAIENSLENFEF